MQSLEGYVCSRHTSNFVCMHAVQCSLCVPVTRQTSYVCMPPNAACVFPSHVILRVYACRSTLRVFSRHTSYSVCMHAARCYVCFLFTRHTSCYACRSTLSVFPRHTSYSVCMHAARCYVCVSVTRHTSCVCMPLNAACVLPSHVILRVYACRSMLRVFSLHTSYFVCMHAAQRCVCSPVTRHTPCVCSMLLVFSLHTSYSVCVHAAQCCLCVPVTVCVYACRQKLRVCPVTVRVYACRSKLRVCSCHSACVCMPLNAAWVTSQFVCVHAAQFPILNKQKEELEKVQKNAARSITNNRDYPPGCTSMNTQRLGRIPLDEYRARIKTTAFYKGMHSFGDIPIDIYQINNHSINTRQNQNQHQT